MEKIKGLAIELDLDHLSVDRGLRGLKDNLRTVNSEMKRNMSAFDRSDKSIQKYETRLMGLNKKLDVQKIAVSEAKKEYEKMVEQHGKGSKEAEKAARDYNNQAAALNNLERYIERATNELREFEKQQRIASSGWTQLGDKLESYGGKLKGIGDNMNQVGGKMTRGITLPAIGAAAAVSGVVGAFGWKRLTGLDSAKSQLEGLGYAAKDVERITDQVTVALEGGMTTMAEGTAVAAGALAAGVKEGKELERYIKLVGDAAVGAKRPVADMAMIFNRVQGSGKMMTQELNSIEQGMPGFSKAMSKHLGVSSEKLRKMVTDGKVTSKDFLDVMDSFAGNMAGAYAKSWDGMVANTKAYIGIIGENFLRGIFEDSKKSLADFIEMLKSPEIQRRAAEMGEKTRVAFNKMKDSIMDVVNWYQDLDDGQKTMIKRLGLMVVAGGPVLQFTGKLTSGLGTVFEATGKLSKAIGVARGAGLVAGLASLGPLAVGGIAVAGIAGVGLAIYKAREKMREGEEGTVEYAKAQLDLAKAKGDELEATNEQIEQTGELIESYFEEEERVNNLIDSYDGLLEKSKLSSKEFGEFIDLQEELSYTKTPERVDEINDRLEELRKKSGMSKDELNNLLKANGDIEELLPGTTTKIDEYGNSYSVAADEVRELIDAELELKRSQIYETLVEDSETLNREASKYKDITIEVLQAEQDILDKKIEISDIEKEHLDNGQKIRDIEEERESLAQTMRDYNEGNKDISFEEYAIASDRNSLLNDEKFERDIIHKSTEKELEVLQDALGVDQERLDELRDNKSLIDDAYQSHLNNYDILKKQLEEETGIKLVLGEENELIDKQIEKNEEAIKKLEEKKQKHGDNDGELQKQLDKLDKENELLLDSQGVLDQIGTDLLNSGANIDEINNYLSDSNREYAQLNDKQRDSNTKLDIFKGKLEENNQKTREGVREEERRTKEASKDVDKSVNVSDDGTVKKMNEKAMETKKKYVDVIGRGIDDLNKKASSPISKAINFVGKGLAGIKPPGFASGTPPSGHKGGPAVIGERGSELVGLPSGHTFLSPGTDTLLDLPRGTHVIPHQETKRIMRSAPRYARGTRDWSSALGNSEFARLLVANSRSESSVVVSSESNSDTQFDKLIQATLQQNQLLMQLLAKDNTAIVGFEDVYQPIKKRLNQDEYSRNKQRRR